MTSGTQKPGLRERKKQRTRASIVTAATRLFVEQGYEGTTIAQIAEAADVAPGTVFIHFPTKADLVFSLLDAVIGSARERLLDEPGEGPAVELLVSWILDDLGSGRPLRLPR